MNQSKGQQISVQISFKTLGLMLSAPEDLLLLKLILIIFCISPGLTGLQNILLVVGWNGCEQYFVNSFGAHFSNDCTRLSPTEQ